MVRAVSLVRVSEKDIIREQGNDSRPPPPGAPKNFFRHPDQADHIDHQWLSVRFTLTKARFQSDHPDHQALGLGSSFLLSALKTRSGTINPEKFRFHRLPPAQMKSKPLRVGFE